MKVVLVTKIKNLGNIGDIVDVKSGFARNFLLPYHKACLLYTSPSPRDTDLSRMPSSA